MVLTGLRGVGKTVLLDSFKPLAAELGWVWVGTDLSESTSISEDSLAIRLCTDLSPVTSDVVVATEEVRQIGFAAGAESVHHRLSYGALIDAYNRIPGLSLDKVKGVLESAWSGLSKSGHIRGIIFAYDEAQNLTDQSAKEQYPLSLLLDCFQSLQRQGLPLMLVLTGLPTLFPKLVEARTYSERMFRLSFCRALTGRRARTQFGDLYKTLRAPSVSATVPSKRLSKCREVIRTSYSSSAGRFTTSSSRESTRVSVRQFPPWRSNRNWIRISFPGDGRGPPIGNGSC